MKVRELGIPDAYEISTDVFPDDRGLFVNPFRARALAEAIGRPLHVRQTNHSASKRGVVRGVHFSMLPPGQAKYVYCPRGAVLDVVIDIRLGSPTFGVIDSVRLDDVDRRAVYLAEGLGHAFMSLQDDSVVTYLCSTLYNPSGEHGVDPTDPAITLPWPADVEPVLSPKDADAPTLAEAAAQGLLPAYDDCLEHYRRLRTSGQ